MGNTTAGKIEVNRGVDKNEISKNEIPQAYGIPLSTQLTYLKKGDCIEQQALQGDDILKHKDLWSKAKRPV